MSQLSAQEIAQNKLSALKELAQKYGFQFGDPGCFRDIADACDNYIPQDTKSLLSKLTPPQERKFSEQVPDSTIRQEILKDVLAYYRNGYNKPTATQTKPSITWGDKNNQITTKQPDPRLIELFGDPIDPENRQAPVAATPEAPRRVVEAAALPEAAKSLRFSQTLEKLTMLLNSFDSQVSLLGAIGQSTALLRELNEIEREDPKFSYFNDEQLQEMISKVDALLKKVLEIRQNRHGQDDISIHDSIQSPVFGLSSRLPEVLRRRHTRDVSSMITLG